MVLQHITTVTVTTATSSNDDLLSFFNINTQPSLNHNSNKEERVSRAYEFTRH